MTKETNSNYYGLITQKLFEYVKLNQPCSYTELNKYYQFVCTGRNTLEDWDPVKDRGGSFSHHFVNMRNKSKRNYSGKIEYLIKDSDGWWMLDWNTCALGTIK
tara:strand:- start:5072 stop:5380 length:309 start_codon:yes stop_codon:yes gene_type:complete